MKRKNGRTLWGVPITSDKKHNRYYVGKHLKGHEPSHYLPTVGGYYDPSVRAQRHPEPNLHKVLR